MKEAREKRDTMKKMRKKAPKQARGVDEPDKKPSADEEHDSKPSADEAEDASEDTVLMAVPEAEAMPNECVFCMDEPKVVALIPCGHKCLCEACAERVQVGDSCPICRAPVSAKYQIFD